MRYKNRKISEPNIEILVIPRQGEDIVFKAQAISSMDEFDKKCPAPKAPMKVVRGGQKVEDTENNSFKEKQLEFGKKRIGYMIIKSLEATEDLEWEQLDINDPSTWGLYEKELRDSGFSDIEIMRIVSCVMAANCLDESRLEEARASFLRTLEESDTSSSHLDGRISMPSGGLVNE